MKAQSLAAKRFLAPFAVALLVAPTIATSPATASPASDEAWNPAMLSSEPLFEGTVVRLKYEDGITVVASVGSKVVFKGSKIGSDRSRAATRRVINRSVRVINPMSGRPTSADARRYQEAGRSVYAEAVAAGYTQAEARRIARPPSSTFEEPPIFSSGCVYSEDSYPDPDYEWDGCYKIYDVAEADANAWYAAASGTARGWGTGVLGGGKELQRGYTEIFWNSFEGEIIDASPAGSVPGQDCRAFTIGLSETVELSYQIPLCDDRWTVTWDRYHHRVQWEGHSAGGSGDTVFASGASTLRVPWNVTGARLEYTIGWQYACFC